MTFPLEFSFILVLFFEDCSKDSSDGFELVLMVMNNGQQQQVMVRHGVPISQQQMQQMQQGQQLQQQQQQHGQIQQQQQQQQGGGQASQLQGLLQQQTLVPQNQLQQGQQAPQQQQQQQQGQFVDQSQQQQQQQQQQTPPHSQGQVPVQPPQQQQQQQQQQQHFVMQQQQLRGGPHPGMRGPMMQGQVRTMTMPQQQQQQMQMQQQRFRMQQFRGPMPTSASGEPLRPHFPPQQPMQVMRMPVTSGHQMMVPGSQGQIQGQPGSNQMMTPGPGGPHGPMGPHHMRPPGPPGAMATGSLRLSIPPQQAMPPQPRTPGSTGSQQPSPALTPRSDMGDEMMDSNSSRGPTPVAGEGYDGMQEGFFPNGEPPQKVVKRRPSQQKRRQSQSGMMMPAPPGMPPDMNGPLAKKRARKGSRVDENDYDSYLDSVMSQLKNLPPVTTVEPRLHHFYNACPLYGCGEMPKTFGYDLDTKFGGLEGTYGNASLPNEGDYYNTMPFGNEPPVPNIKTVTITAKGFYNQEFEPPQKVPKQPQPSCMDSPSPDLFYR